MKLHEAARISLTESPKTTKYQDALTRISSAVEYINGLLPNDPTWSNPDIGQRLDNVSKILGDIADKLDDASVKNVRP